MVGVLDRDLVELIESLAEEVLLAATD